MAKVYTASDTCRAYETQRKRLAMLRRSSVWLARVYIAPMVAWGFSFAAVAAAFLACRACAMPGLDALAMRGLWSLFFAPLYLIGHEPLTIGVWVDLYLFGCFPAMLWADKSTRY